MLLVLLACGIALAFWAEAMPFAFLCLATLLCLAATFYATLRKRPWNLVAWGLLFFLLGMMRCAAVLTLPPNDISHLAGNELKVTGRICAEPYRYTTADGSELIRYTAEARETKLKGVVRPAQGKLYIYAGKTDAPGRVGDEIAARGFLRRPHSYGNPGQLDTALLLQVDGIRARLFAGQAGAEITPTEEASFARNIASLREHYLTAMTEVMPKADAAAIFAMLFGGYGGIKPELLEAYTVTGIVHILSVSGSHVSLLAAVAAYLAALLRLPKSLGVILVGSLIFGYTAMAGFVPPAIRAGLMGFLAYLALALDREKEGQRLLWLTGIVMLLVSPLLLFHISFQLSFASTVGILVVAPVARRKLAKFFSAAAQGKAVFLISSFSVTLGTHLATLPIIAWYFQLISLSAFLANLLVVPIVEIIIIIGLAAGIIALALPMAGKIIFGLDSLLLGVTYEMTRALAALPYSQVYVPAMGGGLCCLYGLTLGLALLPPETRAALWAKIKIRRGEIGATVAAVVIICILRLALTPAEMAVHFIDVGQGDAALIVTPKGRAFMIDTGGTRDGNFDVGERVDIPYLRHCGVRELEYIFLTHAHEDHAAATGSISQKIPVKRIFTAGEGREAYLKSMKLSTASDKAGLLSEAVEGSRFVLDGVTVEVIFAPKVKAEALATGNEASNVYRVSYGEVSFLFTGDLDETNEQKLLAQGINPHSDVLKVGHHGSATSTSDEFLRKVAPVYGVFCVGKDNSFGHPRPQVLEKFRRQGIKIYRTDENGAVVFHTDGRKMRVETYR